MSSVNQFPPMVEFGGGLLLSLYCISIWFKSVDKMVKKHQFFRSDKLSVSFSDLG